MISAGQATAEEVTIEVGRTVDITADMVIAMEILGMGHMTGENCLGLECNLEKYKPTYRNSIMSQKYFLLKL